MYSPTMKLMAKFGAAPTRENYLKFAFLGKPPADTPELEETMPEQFRLPAREYDKLDATAIPTKDPDSLTGAQATYDSVRGLSKRLPNRSGDVPMLDTESSRGTEVPGATLPIYHGRMIPGATQKATPHAPAKTAYPMNTENPPMSPAVIEPEGTEN